MSKPHYFTFTAYLERNDGCNELDTPVEVTCRVESYAASAGFANEPCGRKVVEITNVEHDGLPLSSLELAELHEQAWNQLSFH